MCFHGCLSYSSARIFHWSWPIPSGETKSFLAWLLRPFMIWPFQLIPHLRLLACLSALALLEIVLPNCKLAQLGSCSFYSLFLEYSQNSLPFSFLSLFPSYPPHLATIQYPFEVSDYTESHLQIAVFCPSPALSFFWCGGPGDPRVLWSLTGFQIYIYLQSWSLPIKSLERSISCSLLSTRTNFRVWNRDPN